MKWLVAVLALLSTAGPSAPQERPRVPDDSIEIQVIGCLKGRVLKASDIRYVDTQSGPDVRSRSFRLAGKREVMQDVKKENGHLVEVVGIVKRSALDDRGVKLGNRVTITGGSPASRSGIPSVADNVDVMDVTTVRQRAGSCRTD
jgi:hypothetical protein